MIASKIPEKIKNVTEVPTVGILIKVGTKVPMMLPMVFAAPSCPTILPFSSRESVVYFTRDGVTVPKRKRGKTNTTAQATNAATTRKPVFTVKIKSPEISMIAYFPKSGIAPIQTAATMMRLYSLSGSGCLSASRPPKMFPSARAIMIVPMMMVHTICEDEKYGARSLLAPSSTAIRDIPEKNSVIYKNFLFDSIFLFVKLSIAEIIAYI